MNDGETQETKNTQKPRKNKHRQQTPTIERHEEQTERNEQSKKERNEERKSERTQDRRLKERKTE